MKNIIRISAMLAASVLAFCACEKPEPEVDLTFGLDKNSIVAGPDGKEERIEVHSATSWVAEIPENASWVQVIPSMGDASTTCRVKIDASVKAEERPASIKFISSDRQVTRLDITQMGYEKSILLDLTEMKLASSKRKDLRYFERKIITNVKEFYLDCKYKGDTKDWILTEEPTIKPDLEYGDRPGEVTIRINWKNNVDPVQREVQIEFKPVDPAEALKKPAILTITQDPAPKIEDNAAGDSLALTIIADKLGCMTSWQGSEPLKNWYNVLLWEDGDSLPRIPGTDKPDEKALGRVKAFKLQSLKTEESIPAEISHLKYLREVIIMSNVNTFRKNIDLGPEICELEHLEYLTIGAYGLTSLPKELVKLGEHLVYLELWGNQLRELPEFLNQFRFPKLKYLGLSGNDRGYFRNLKEELNGKPFYHGEHVGLWIDTRKNDRLKKLFTWENLEYLSLSNNMLEGPIPDFKVGEVVDVEGHPVEIKAYSADDPEIKELGDTIGVFLLNSELGKTIPRILPKATRASVNLSYMTGTIPDWVLYHPFLIELDPETLIFNQRYKTYDSMGKRSGFDNVPANFDYYFADDVYPLYKKKYLIQPDQL